MKIIVVSTPVFAINPPIGTLGYAGLEVLAWQIAKGLAERGHQVALIAPDGSSCPGVQVICTGPAGRHSEQAAYGGWAGNFVDVDGQIKDRKWPGYWHVLKKAEMGNDNPPDCVIDHSVVGTEHFLVRIDGQSRWISFKELWKWAESKWPVLFVGGSTEIRVTGLEVPSATDQFRIRWKPVQSVIRHPRKHSIHKVKTKGGHFVKVTSGHSMIIAGEGGLTDASASESVGASAAIAGRIPASTLDRQFWPDGDRSDLGRLLVSGSRIVELVKENSASMLKAESSRLNQETAKTNVNRWCSGNMIRVRNLPHLPKEYMIHNGKGGKPVNCPIRLSDEDLILFGLWIGDGCYSGESSVLLASGVKTKRIGDVVAAEFDAVCRVDKAWPDVKFGINSVILNRLMRSVGFRGLSETKKIPDWIFGLSRRQIGLFLKGYFSADGCISHHLSLSSVNTVLVKQTSVLLALCGVRHNIYRGKKGKGGYATENRMWSIEVPKDCWGQFLKWVGFVQENKNEKVRKGLLTRRSKRGEIPFCLIRQRAERADCKRSKEPVVSFSKIARKLGKDAADSYAKSAIAYREIVSSEPLNREDKYVYDLSVPDTENFFVGTVCCHNSWEAWSYVGKAEGAITCPVLKVCHAPVDTMYRQLPPVEKTCFVGISEDQAAHFKALWNREMKVAHNGVDLEFYKPLGLPRSGRFLFLARFSSIKGADLAIDACLKCGAGLDLVGDTTITNEPDYFNACRKKCDGKQIRMVGPATRGNCVWWMSQAHALLHPNLRFREPFGLAPVEAMACECPVIAFDYGAMRETIKTDHPMCGQLVKTVKEFDQAVKYADFGDPVYDGQKVPDEWRKHCRENAARFSESRMIDRYEELCKEAVATGGW